MSVDTVTLALALLAVVAAATTTAVAGAALFARARLRSAPWRRYGAWAAASVAGVATAGSLYLSEVANFTPCRLCWYQRYAMYPLAAVALAAAVTRARALRWAGMALAAAGAPISAWHVLVERYPTLEGDRCDPFNPCSIVWVRELGVFTIPTMALVGFVTAFTLLAAWQPGRTVVTDGGETAAVAPSQEVPAP